MVAFSPEDISDLYACRSFMEGLAARAAAATITAGELDQLKELQAQMKRHLQPQVLPEYTELNRRFHRLIFSASRRTYLTRTLNQLWDAFPSMLWGNFARTAGQPVPQRDLADIQEHEAIIEALERRDGAAAAERMRHHVEESGQHLLSALS